MLTWCFTVTDSSGRQRNCSFLVPSFIILSPRRHIKMLRRAESDDWFDTPALRIYSVSLLCVKLERRWEKQATLHHLLTRRSRSDQFLFHTARLKLTSLTPLLKHRGRMVAAPQKLSLPHQSHLLQLQLGQKGGSWGQTPSSEDSISKSSSTSHPHYLACRQRWCCCWCCWCWQLILLHSSAMQESTRAQWIEVQGCGGNVR